MECLKIGIILGLCSLGDSTSNSTTEDVPFTIDRCDGKGTDDVLLASLYNRDIEGTVLVCYKSDDNIEWGSVCDNNWDDKDAEVVCRQLGANGPAKAIYDAQNKYMSASAAFADRIMGNFQCTGSETKLMDCAHDTSCGSTRSLAGAKCGETKPTDDNNGGNGGGNDGGPDSGSNNDTVMIVVIVLGCVLGVVGAIGGTWWRYKRCQHRQHQDMRIRELEAEVRRPNRIGPPRRHGDDYESPSRHNPEYDRRRQFVPAVSPGSPPPVYTTADSMEPVVSPPPQYDDVVKQDHNY